MNKNILFLLVFSFLLVEATDLMAQEVTLSGEIRPRFEYRHGYKTLSADGAKAASFISQRTRLNGFFANENFKVGLVI